MTEEDFSKRVTELTESLPDNPNNSPLEDVVLELVREVRQRGKGGWKEDVAGQVMKEYEWFIKKVKQS